MTSLGPPSTISSRERHTPRIALSPGWRPPGSPYDLAFFSIPSIHDRPRAKVWCTKVRQVWGTVSGRTAANCNCGWHAEEDGAEVTGMALWVSAPRLDLLGALSVSGLHVGVRLWPRANSVRMQIGDLALNIQIHFKITFNLRVYLGNIVATLGLQVFCRWLVSMLLRLCFRLCCRSVRPVGAESFHPILMPRVCMSMEVVDCH